MKARYSKGRVHSDYDGYMYDILGFEIADALIKEAYAVPLTEVSPSLKGKKKTFGTKEGEQNGLSRLLVSHSRKSKSAHV